MLSVSFFLQVTIEYQYVKGACVPLRVHTIVISLQHDETVTLETLRKEVMERVVKSVIPAKYIDSKTIFHIQPSGKFIIGGPQVSFYSCPCLVLVNILSLIFKVS